MINFPFQILAKQPKTVHQRDQGARNKEASQSVITFTNKLAVIPLCWNKQDWTLHLLGKTDGSLWRCSWQQTTCCHSRYRSACTQPPFATTQLSDYCTHEETNTKMILHVAHCVQNGFKKICVRTVDTDVLSVAIVQKLCPIVPDQDLQGFELWVGLGTEKHLSLPIPLPTAWGQVPRLLSHYSMLSQAVTVLQASVVRARRMHGMLGKGPVTDSFLHLSNTPSAIEENVFAEIEQFVVILYSRTCPASTVNGARRYLFAKRKRSQVNIPPSQASLLQHIKRAAFQAGHLWSPSLNAAPVYPSPSDWGWQRDEDGRWTSYWTKLPDASKACIEFTRCGCNPKKGCRRMCKCLRASLNCTELCKCCGSCS